VFFFIAISSFHLRRSTGTLWHRRSCDNHDDLLALITASREEVVDDIFTLASRIC